MRGRQPRVVKHQSGNDQPAAEVEQVRHVAEGDPGVRQGKPLDKVSYYNQVVFFIERPGHDIDAGCGNPGGEI